MVVTFRVRLVRPCPIQSCMVVLVTRSVGGRQAAYRRSYLGSDLFLPPRLRGRKARCDDFGGLVGTKPISPYALIRMLSSFASRAYFAESSRTTLANASALPPTGSVAVLSRLSREA